MATWTVGTVSITRIEEQVGVSSTPAENYLRGLDRELLGSTWIGWCPVTIHPSGTASSPAFIRG